MGCYVCIHCHFYQPPRENPWLEAVESQDSARPYHDWNERITAECYRPNGASRILDGQGRIAKIVNNYSRISFNFGPTLLSWMEERDPESYAQILKADRESRQLFSGHGSALAQAYNHIILPLANSRDKHTQVVWGIRDFQHRFGRDPEGMWLAETAVDVETLEILSSAGIKFTVLAPHQAGKLRAEKDARWTNLDGQGIDSKRPYMCHLSSGRKIGIFFYDGAISRAVAFDKLLFDGANLARRLAGRFDPHGDSHQLVHIATDGETYGHHHPHGDMALAYALDYIEQNKLARLTNYGKYFAKHPPTHHVEILEKTSWSCMHGVARWEDNCGCNSMSNSQWNQEWRKPLREALDWLRDELVALYDRDARELLRDPWTARDKYVKAVMDRSRASVDVFLAGHAARDLSPEERVRALRLLEMQRYLMLMYTSCGWFFDEPTGTETIQVLQYAGRAVQLSEQLFGGEREEEFLSRLEKVRSNLPQFGNGRDIYERFVRPAMLDLFGVAAHYAISSLFDGYLQRESMYCYAVDLQEAQVFENGRKKLSVGQAQITSHVTRAQLNFRFAVLYYGDHNLRAGIRPIRDGDEFQPFVEDVSQMFSQDDLGGCSQMIDQHFGKETYSLKSLFRDERQRILTQIVNSTLAGIHEVYRDLYEQHASQVSFLSELHIPLPAVLEMSAQFALGNEILRCLSVEKLDFDRVRTLLEASKRDGITLEAAPLVEALRNRLEASLRRWTQRPTDLATLQMLEELVSLARGAAFKMDLWALQNKYYELRDTLASAKQLHVDHVWLKHFQSLGDKLGIAPSDSLSTLITDSGRESENFSPMKLGGPASSENLPIQ